MPSFYKPTKPAIIIAGGLGIFLLVYFAGDNFLLPNKRLGAVILRAINYDAGNEIHFSDRNTTKYVLLWTNFFTEPRWKNFFAEMPAILTSSKNTKCRFMRRTDLPVEEADALVFHGPDIDYNDIPREQRSAMQRWIYFAMESSHNLHFGEPVTKRAINDIKFNWTMSYSRRSDIWYPYGKFQNISTADDPEKLSKISSKIEGFKSGFANRKHDAIWIVSNCRASSFRERVVKKLQSLGLDVHILGKCGGKEFNESVATLDYNQYRFYFAFENSLCDEYVTEKVFQGYDAAIQGGIIPVLFGASPETYEALLPPNSYIDARAFKNVAELGFVLEKLSSNNDTYYQKLLAKFYEWHLTSELQDYQRNFTTKHYVSHFGFPALCEKLWSTDQAEKSNVADVGAHLSGCRSAPLERDYFNMTTLELLQMNIPFVIELLALVNSTTRISIEQMADRVDHAKPEDHEVPLEMLKQALGIF